MMVVHARLLLICLVMTGYHRRRSHWDTTSHVLRRRHPSTRGLSHGLIHGLRPWLTHSLVHGLTRWLGSGPIRTGIVGAAAYIAIHPRSSRTFGLPNGWRLDSPALHGFSFASHPSRIQNGVFGQASTQRGFHQIRGNRSARRSNCGPNRFGKSLFCLGRQNDLLFHLSPRALLHLLLHMSAPCLLLLPMMLLHLLLLLRDMLLLLLVLELLLLLLLLTLCNCLLLLLVLLLQLLVLLLRALLCLFLLSSLLRLLLLRTLLSLLLRLCTLLRLLLLLLSRPLLRLLLRLLLRVQRGSPRRSIMHRIGISVRLCLYRRSCRLHCQRIWNSPLRLSIAIGMMQSSRSGTRRTVVGPRSSRIIRRNWL